MSEKPEREYLTYTGNKIPKVIRLAWTIFIAFGFYYLIRYGLADLKVWLQGGTP